MSLGFEKRQPFCGGFSSQPSRLVSGETAMGGFAVESMDWCQIFGTSWKMNPMTFAPRIIYENIRAKKPKVWIVVLHKLFADAPRSSLIYWVSIELPEFWTKREVFVFVIPPNRWLLSLSYPRFTDLHIPCQQDTTQAMYCLDKSCTVTQTHRQEFILVVFWEVQGSGSTHYCCSWLWLRLSSEGC